MKTNYHVAFTKANSITQSFTISCLPSQILQVVKDHRKEHPELKRQRSVITKTETKQ